MTCPTYPGPGSLADVIALTIVVAVLGASIWLSAWSRRPPPGRGRAALGRIVRLGLFAAYVIPFTPHPVLPMVSMAVVEAATMAVEEVARHTRRSHSTGAPLGYTWYAAATISRWSGPSLTGVAGLGAVALLFFHTPLGFSC